MRSVVMVEDLTQNLKTGSIASQWYEGFGHGYENQSLLRHPGRFVSNEGSS